MQSIVNISTTHPSWHAILQKSLKKMSSLYLQEVINSPDYLPKFPLLFSAFSEPLANTRYILLGESPYPRAQSANGFAFWDSAINSIWSTTGFSRELNRATSLRNFVKMLLFARGDLKDDFAQAAIASLDKSKYLQTIDKLFSALLRHGFLLLNASLIYSPGKVLYHAKNWRPFIDSVLNEVVNYDASITLILLGKISERFANLPYQHKIIAEHPYNISFITNKKINDFFRGFDLLCL